jgi:hypothetical protein
MAGQTPAVKEKNGIALTLAVQGVRAITFLAEKIHRPISDFSVETKNAFQEKFSASFNGRSFRISAAYSSERKG